LLPEWSACLEELVGRLSRADGIGYEPPLNLPGQQADGAIKLEGNVLVLEDRWR
jgi:hypothetical protein